MQQSPSKGPVAARIVAAAAALAMAGYVGVASDMPNGRSPLPLTTIVPMLWLWDAVRETPPLAGIIQDAVPSLVGPLLLLAWHPKLLRGTADFRRPIEHCD